MAEDFEWEKDYAAMCSPYGFRVHSGAHGKELRATAPFNPGQVLLTEVPLVVWPLNTSALDESFICCENCMRVKPFGAEGGRGAVKTQRLCADAAAAHTPQEMVGPHAVDGQTNGANHTSSSLEGEEVEAGISIYREGASSSLWFCSLRCHQQALGVAVDTPEMSGEQEEGLLPTCTSSLLRKRDQHGFVKECSSSSNHNSSSSKSNSSSNSCKEGADGAGVVAARRVYGWQEFLSPEGLHALRLLDKKEKNKETHRESNPGPAGDACGSPIGLEALGRVVARIAATAATLHALHQWTVDDAYAEACRPFLRLVAAEQSECLMVFDVVDAAKQLQGVMGSGISAVLGTDVAAALLGFGALSFFFGTLMRNAQELFIWGATETGSLMVLRAAGVYVLQACCNHSCVPNCIVENGSDACINLKAERRIEEGEEITINYVPLSLNQQQRQKLLLDSYRFICDCMRCQQERQQADTQECS
ncbi:hypothetical protein ACSSS7_007965 [Eimeria intestinalis]